MHRRPTLTAGLFGGLLLLMYWTAQAAVEFQAPPGQEQVGPTADGGWIMPTGHKVRPAGQTVAFAGRPVALALGKDGTVLYVKDHRGLRVLGTDDFQLRQQLTFPNKD